MYPNYGDELRVSSQRSGKKVSECMDQWSIAQPHSRFNWMLGVDVGTTGMFNNTWNGTVQSREKKGEALLQNSDVEMHECPAIR